MKEENKKIAEWLGFRVTNGSTFLFEEERGWYRSGALPNYCQSDADAISLLPVLVKKGYLPRLVYYQGLGWQCEISTEYTFLIQGRSNTIASAISSAVLQLIESETTK